MSAERIAGLDAAKRELEIVVSVIPGSLGVLISYYYVQDQGRKQCLHMFEENRSGRLRKAKIPLLKD